MIEIEVPTLKCVPHELTAEPFSNIERLEELQRLLKNGSATPTPVAKVAGDTFVIVLHWDYVKYLSEVNERIRILVLEETDDDPLYYCINRHASILNLSWAYTALAISRAKKQLRISDARLSAMVKIERSTIARYNRIVQKLNPKLFDLAKSGRLTYSECRSLITLDATVQEDLYEKISKRSWSAKQLVSQVLPAHKSRATNQPVENREVKPRDVIKLETAISEIVGYPMTINNSEGNIGTIEYEFFDRLSMLDVLTKLRRGFTEGARPKGKIVISYESLDEFSRLTEGFQL